MRFFSLVVSTVWVSASCGSRPPAWVLELEQREQQVEYPISVVPVEDGADFIVVTKAPLRFAEHARGRARATFIEVESLHGGDPVRSMLLRDLALELLQGRQPVLEGTWRDETTVHERYVLRWRIDPDRRVEHESTLAAARCPADQAFGCAFHTQGATRTNFDRRGEVCGCGPRCAQGMFYIMEGGHGYWPNGWRKGSGSCAVHPPE